MTYILQYSNVLIAVGSGIAGILLGFVLSGKRKFDEAAVKQKAEKMLVDAQKESLLLKTRSAEKAIESKKQFEAEQLEFAKQIDKMEQVLAVKSGLQQKREARIQELQRALQEEERSANAIKDKTAELEKEISERIIQITGLSVEKTKEQLITQYEQTFLADAELRIQHDMEWAAERAARDAKDIVAGAIYRFAAPTSVEHGHHNIIVPRDEIKGRIVGRGGRNIAFFENLFGVDVIFNDEPNLIIVSCFNLVQRETARLAMERLMREKNITEEVITRAKFLADQDMEKILKKEGDKALKILGMENANPELSKLLGRLKFRTSYGQCIMSHCFEVAYFSRLLASEIGANERVAWIAGFFHDVGKAIDQETGGSHDVLTKEILEKYKFSPEIVHAAWTHHDAAPQETIEARIVQAADAISAGRPGARAESVERYLEKIKALEETALSFAGVKKAYAINAGREVRVIVEPDKIKDDEVGPMADQIAAKVQEQGGYPGKIKVIAIRTTKTTDYAK